MAAKRIKSTRVGDVFSVSIDVDHVKYMQYIVSDLTQLNSDVIRVFNKVYQKGENPDFKDIVNGTVDFYAHCDTKAGVKQGLWEPIGNIPDIGKTDHILFRDSKDYGNSKIKVSNNWWIWRINEEFIHIGKLIGENRKAEIGIIFSPPVILNRIKTGSYGIFYPDFE
jgi:hypothetical protein